MKVYHQTLISAIAGAALLQLIIPSDNLFAEAVGIFNDPSPDHIGQSHSIVNGHANSALRGDHPGQGQGVRPPNEIPASPDDCVIVAIAGTRDPERRLEDFPDDDEGETFECEYADGTTVPLELDNDQLTELREWLNGKLPDAAGGPFKSGEQTLSRQGSSVGANGAIRPPPGVPMSSLVRQDNNGRGRGIGPPTGRHLREKQNRQRRTAEVVGEKYVLVSMYVLGLEFGHVIMDISYLQLTFTMFFWGSLIFRTKDYHRRLPRLPLHWQRSLY